MKEKNQKTIKRENTSHRKQNAKQNQNNFKQDDKVKPKETWEDKQKIKQDLLIKMQALEKKGFEFSKKFEGDKHNSEFAKFKIRDNEHCEISYFVCWRQPHFLFFVLNYVYLLVNFLIFHFHL